MLSKLWFSSGGSLGCKTSAIDSTCTLMAARVIPGNCSPLSPSIPLQSNSRNKNCCQHSFVFIRIHSLHTWVFVTVILFGTWQKNSRMRSETEPQSQSLNASVKTWSANLLRALAIPDGLTLLWCTRGTSPLHCNGGSKGMASVCCGATMGTASLCCG